MRASEVVFTRLEEVHVADPASKTVARWSARLLVASFGWATAADQAASKMSCCYEISRS